MPEILLDNVVALPMFGKPITLDDEGIYYAMHAATGAVHSVLKLVYKDDWYLYQLKNAPNEDEFYWSMLTGHGDYVLNSMTTDELRYRFCKPKYAEPKGAWQVIRNSRFGFGKFTPLGVQESPSYGLLVFSGNEMRAPLLIHKADEDFLEETEESMHQQAMHQEVELV
jgi:hypothetical protein